MNCCNNEYLPPTDFQKLSLYCAFTQFFRVVYAIRVVDFLVEHRAYMRDIAGRLGQAQKYQ